MPDKIGYRKKMIKKITVGRTKYKPHRCRLAINDGLDGLRAANRNKSDYL
jgi:hypothetical protein